MNARRPAFLSLLVALALAACAPLAASAPHGVAPLPGGGGGGAPVDSYSTNSTTGPVPQGVVPPSDLAAKTVDQANAATTDGSGAQTAAPAANGAPAAADRLVVKTASLALVVANPSDAVVKITALATGMGGFVVNSNTSEASVDSQGNPIMQATLTVRVPSAQLDAALAQIRAMAAQVQSVNVTGQDVTADYTDLQSRLRNAEAAETKLQQIMDSANKTEDVLAVFNQLTAVQQQVEQLKGQIQYYDESASMSAISMTLTPDVLNQPIAVGGWQPQGVAKDAIESLVRAFQGLATGAIWIGLYVLPLALVIGLPLYALLRLLMRRIRRPKPMAV